MIIKSMSRHQPTFDQLVDYMEDGRQDKKYTIKNNIFSKNPEKIKTEFETNATFFKKRKDSVYMYHEVISITKSKSLDDDKQKEILRKIILEYIKKRAKNNLVYGVLHDDKTDNFHYHLLISSNELEESKKHRLSKKQFDTIKKDLEIMVLDKYPELQQGVVINKPATEKLSHREYESKRRTGKRSKRDSVKQRLKNVFDTSESKQEFFEKLSKEQLEIYTRGKSIGIIDKVTGRKHRLKTLGMLDDFNHISGMIEKEEVIQKETGSRKETLEENRRPYKETVSIKNNQYNTESTKSEDNKKSDYSEKEENKTERNDSATDYENSEKYTKGSYKNEQTQEEIEIQKRKETLKKSRASENKHKINNTRNR